MTATVRILRTAILVVLCCTMSARGADSDLTQDQLRDLAARVQSDTQDADDALQEISRLGPQAKGIVPLLLPAIGQPRAYRDVWRICYALGAIGPDAADAVKPLAQQIQTAEDLDKSFYADALARIGAPALPALQELAQSSDRWIRGASMTALARSGDEGCALVRDLSTSKNAGIRAAAVSALASAKSNDANAKCLSVALRDGDSAVRRAAANGIANFAAADPSATDSLLAMLDEPELLNRCFAALALGRLRQKPEQVLPRLKPFLEAAPGKDADELCDLTLQAIACFGHDAKSLTPQIIACLSRQESVRDAALEALAAIGAPDASTGLPQVLQLIASDDGHARELALKTIFAMGPDAAGAAAPLKNRLGKGHTVDEDFLILKALIAIGAPARNALADMTPYVVMNFGSLSQAPDFLVRGMASIDPDASIALIEKETRKPTNDFFDQRGSQGRGAITRIKGFKQDVEQVKAAIAAGQEDMFPQECGRERVLEWGTALRAGDSLDRAVSLLGKPSRVTADGVLEYTDMDARVRQTPVAPIRVKISNGKFESITSGDVP